MQFWEKPLVELNDKQWEALCDGCGLCCMHKFEDEDSGEVFYTSIACRLFDDKQCQCQAYLNRFEQVEDCMQIRNFTAQQYAWLPVSCAYRLRFEHKPLLPWHPLISGNSNSVHRYGISMQYKTTSELHVAEEDMPTYIIGDAL